VRACDEVAGLQLQPVPDRTTTVKMIAKGAAYNFSTFHKVFGHVAGTLEYGKGIRWSDDILYPKTNISLYFLFVA
jgi:hypothetical protein